MFYINFMNYRIRIRNSARNLICIRNRIRIFFGFVTALLTSTYIAHIDNRGINCLGVEWIAFLHLFTTHHI